MQFFDEEGVRAAAESKWQYAGAETRAEFRQNKASYVAFEVAQARGLVRIYSPAASRSDVRVQSGSALTQQTTNDIYRKLVRP